MALFQDAFGRLPSLSSTFDLLLKFCVEVLLKFLENKFQNGICQNGLFHTHEIFYDNEEIEDVDGGTAWWYVPPPFSSTIPVFEYTTLCQQVLSVRTKAHR